MNPFDHWNSREPVMSMADVNQYIASLAKPKKGVADTPKSKKGSGNQNPLTSLISEAAGAGGALGGAALGATVGSAVPVVGTAIGGLLGAGIGGFLGGTGGRLVENKVRDNEYRPGDALEEGALSGLFGAGPGRLLKVAKGGAELAAKGGAHTLESALMEGGATAAGEPLKTGIRGKLMAKGNNLLLSQYDSVGAPVKRATRPAQTISQLADFGVTKPADAERLASAITGGSGVVNKAVSTAVGAAGKVNTSNIPAVLEHHIKDLGLVGNDAKEVTQIVTAKLGALGDSADPKKTLEIMRNLESRIADYSGRGGNAKMADPRRLEKAKVLQAVRNDLQDSLYNAAGANKNLKSVLTPELRDALVKLHPNEAKWQQYVDKKVMGAKTVGDLRSATAPFVRVKQLIDEGADNAVTVGGRVGNFANSMQGGGPTAFIASKAADLVKDPVARLAGNTLRAAGGANAGAPLQAPGKLGIASRLGALGGGEAAVSTMDTAKAAAAGYNAMDGNSPDNQPPDLMSGGMVPATGSDPMQQLGLGQDEAPAQTPYGRENLLADIARDPKNAEKYVQYYQLMDQIFNQPSAKAAGAFAKPTVGQYGQATTGLNSLGQLEDMLAQDPNVIARNNTPGQGLPLVGSSVSGALGTDRYRSLTNNLLNSMVRINTGAAMTKDEEEFYRRAYLPQPGDSPEAIQNKLNTLRQFFRPIVNYSGQDQPQSLEAALGGQGGYN